MFDETQRASAAGRSRRTGCAASRAVPLLPPTLHIQGMLSVEKSCSPLFTGAGPSCVCCIDNRTMGPGWGELVGEARGGARNEGEPEPEDLLEF
jgi:hypothetical protein